MGHQELPHFSKQRHKRTRTGCERCREQRRKCDEGKPQCKRCIKADAVCTYFAHVSFRDENSLTVSNDVDPTGASNPLQYPSIKFVLENGLDPRKTDDNPSCSADDECLDGEESLANVSTSPPPLVLGQSWPLVGQSSLSSTEIGLLKHYNHLVAPWLDVYDQQQTFGQCVTRLAMTSPCVLEALLQLSAVSSGRPIEIVKSRGAGVFHLQAMMRPPGAESPFSALRMIACFVLARTLLFVNAIPDTWEPSFHGGGAFVYLHKFNFCDTTDRQMWFAFLTLILRLEIAYCLLNQRAPVWIPKLIHHILNESKNEEADKSHEILNASLRCLMHLVDVMNICFPLPEADNDTELHQSAVSTLSRTARAAKWKELVNELRIWHTNRPLGLQALLEVDDPESTFPTVVFTSGAGISSNALYHTAMLLLLSDEQVDAQYSSAETNTPEMSPLWHARRVCGIGINSEPGHMHCWDPVFIAAFSLAARRITHPSQRDTIITCLYHVKATGWHIDSLVDKLHSDWDSGLDR